MSYKTKKKCWNMFSDSKIEKCLCLDFSFYKLILEEKTFSYQAEDENEMNDSCRKLQVNNVLIKNIPPGGAILKYKACSALQTYIMWCMCLVMCMFSEGMRWLGADLCHPALGGEGWSGGAACEAICHFFQEWCVSFSSRQQGHCGEDSTQI